MQLKFRGVLIGVLFLPILAAESEVEVADDVDQQNRKNVLERVVPFLEPSTYERAPYWGSVTLAVTVAENSLNNHRFRHFSYNGGLVGPTIRAQPGDTLEIRVQNRLVKDSLVKELTDPHGPHGFYSLNLHPHGLHVSPSGESDNTFIRLDPGDEFTFTYRIPWNQSPGTFWYHPHTHGGVGYQLTNGLAGALIIEGGLDWAPELFGIKDRVMVFQQFRFREGPDGVRQVYPDDVYSRRIGTPSPFSGAPDVPAEVETAINGVVTPMITMRPGEIQRWRLIHAGIDATIQLNIVKEDGRGKLLLHEIAVDGMALGKVVPREVVLLQPGYRSDVLVQAMEPGTYLLYTEVKPAESFKALRGRAVPRTYVAKIYVDGRRLDMKMPAPTAFAGYQPPDIKVPIAGKPRKIVFDRGKSSFTVNGKEFDPKQVDQVVQLGSAEQWTIESQTEGHPFHIHVNPFQVEQPDGGWLWRDTLFVPSGETRTIRMQFEDYDGRTVLHCHNLDHEDQGMMQIVQIAKDAKAEEARRERDRQREVVDGVVTASAPIMPAWNLPGADGKSHAAADFSGRNVLFVFHRGLRCPLCASQISVLARRAAEFERLGFQIVAIGATAPGPQDAEFVRQNGVSFPVLSNPDLTLFKALHLVTPEQPPDHGIFLVDRSGIIRWSTTGDTPADLDTVLAAASASPFAR